jgi:hypothetical protein
MANVPEHKAWARLLRSRAANGVGFRTFWDEPRQFSIDVFTGRFDVEEGGQHLAATIGLMDIVQAEASVGPICTEVLVERGDSGEFVDNVVSTIAFCAIKDAWKVMPGRVFPDVVRMYVPDTGLPHVMFVPIFRWDDMGRVAVEGKTIYPLLAVPISEAELRFREASGYEALMDCWEAAGTPVDDWQRASVA